jgi:hypothetical protein
MGVKVLRTVIVLTPALALPVKGEGDKLYDIVKMA